ncbi:MULTISPECIES: four helix bundle protein [Aequorivita]|uniref:Four helix bundle protein n=2 Tax=Aequorivita TaxID=153265 RepID=A0AB35YWB2_9FLAO|nr:four helix bundle protein [Aequorivita sp. Ant34-E75]WGF92926.1 four helix bundle protein [Aequorivita sp. Ant34-E75]
MVPNQLEDRLIKFAVEVILMCKHINGSFAAEHLTKQLIRSSTSVALNYGEARSAESSRDFLHKMKISLKELRESFVNMKIQRGANLITNVQIIDRLLIENNELISIFVASIKTASQKNNIQ